jgi:hypothetical protein
MAWQERGTAVVPWGAAAIALALAALHLALVAGLPVWILGTGALDDALYLRGAEHLAAGDWLGPYDNRTLARGPFYPAFVAFASQLGVPIRVAQSALYLAAGALLLGAVRPWPGPRWTRIAAFAVFAFDPMLYQTDLLRVTREGVYVPLGVLVLALGAVSLRARDAAPWARLLWAVGLGSALGGFWLTREEGPWILPALAVGALVLVLPRFGRAGAHRALARDAAVLALAAATSVACVQLTSAQNDRRYGTWCAVEFRQQAFARAYGALLRVDPDRRAPFVPVTREALAHASDAGPAAAEIATVLLSGVKDGYVRYGCAYHHVDPCDGEFRGGWWMFALRDAAAIAGHYGSGADAERFYAQLADEIDAACAAQRIRCGPPRTGFAPPLAPGDRTAIAVNTLRAAGHLARFTRFELAPGASTGSEEYVARAGDFLHSRVLARGADAPEFTDRADRLRAAALRAIAEEYPWFVPPLALAALLACAWRLRDGLRALEEPWLAVAAMLATAVASRVALVGVVATTSIPVLDPRYLAPAYPLLLLFAAVAGAGGLEPVRRRSRRR